MFSLKQVLTIWLIAMTAQGPGTCCCAARSLARQSGEWVAGLVGFPGESADPPAGCHCRSGSGSGAAPRSSHPGENPDCSCHQKGRYPALIVPPPTVGARDLDGTFSIVVAWQDPARFVMGAGAAQVLEGSPPPVRCRTGRDILRACQILRL